MDSIPKKGDDHINSNTSEYSCDTFNKSISEISDIAHKLKETNARKKNADKNAILLLNRISLLQKEADRTARRVRTTKDRALEALHVKDQRLQTAQVKSTREAMLTAEKQRVLEANTRRERNIKQSVALKHQLVESNRREIAHSLKEEARVMGERVAQAQAEEVEKKRRARDEIRRREAAIKDRKHREHEEKVRKTHELYLAKLQQEEREAARAEALVQELADREKKHIQKLKDSQREQREVLTQLESLFSSTGGSLHESQIFK